MNMNQLIVSTKFIPGNCLRNVEKRLAFFKQMRQIGYQYIHFDYNRFEMKELLDENWMMRLLDDILVNDMHIVNSHLFVNPFDNIWEKNDLEKERILWSVLEQCFKYNKALQIRDTVYHVPELCRFEIAKCQRFISKVPCLVEMSAKYGCCICMENHYNAQVDNLMLSLLFGRFEESVLKMTFDTGHYLLSGNERIIENNFFGRLCLVHLHDNDKKTDLHMIPDITNKTEVWKRIFSKIKKSFASPSLIIEVGQNAMNYSVDNVESMYWMYEKLCGVLDYYNEINVENE